MKLKRVIPQSDYSDPKYELYAWKSKVVIYEGYNPFAGIDYEIQEFAMKHGILDKLQRIFSCHDTFQVRDFYLEDRVISIEKPQKNDPAFNVKVWITSVKDQSKRLTVQANKSNLISILDQSFTIGLEKSEAPPQG